MTIAIRGDSPAVVASTNNPISVTLNGSRQPQAGDLLLIIHCNNFFDFSAMQTPTVGGSSSGVQVIADAARDNGSNQGHIKSYFYVVGSSGDLTVSVTETGSADEDKMLAVAVLSGVDTNDPIDGASNSGSTNSQTSHVVSGITTSSPNTQMFIHHNTGAGASTASMTVPGSMTTLYNNKTAFMNYVGATELIEEPGATGTRTFTPASSVNWCAVAIGIRAEAEGGGPIEVPVEQALVHDLARPIGSTKVKAFSRALTQDLARPLGASKARSWGRATTEELALEIVPSKKLSLPRAVVEDLTQEVAPVKRKSLERAAEDGLARGFVSTKTVVLGRTAETDQARQVSSSKVKFVELGRAIQEVLARPIGSAKVKFFGRALEDDLAHPFISGSLVPIGRAIVEFLARPLTPFKRRSLGRATEWGVGHRIFSEEPVVLAPADLQAEVDLAASRAESDISAIKDSTDVGAKHTAIDLVRRS